MDKLRKNPTLFVIAIFALILVTTAASFAFFTFSRTGVTTTTIVSGDIEFSYFEDNTDAVLTNAFPVSDEIGAIDENGEYKFQVGMVSNTPGLEASYDVTLIDSNRSTDNYFKNNQIKFALVKNGTFVANTSATQGVLLSELSGFDADSSNGSAIVLSDQTITSGVKDNYKLRIWIADNVDYSNEVDGETSTGVYNNYTYSLRVKVNGSISGYTSVTPTPTTVNATQVSYSNAKSAKGCTDVSCSLNELHEMFK